MPRPASFSIASRTGVTDTPRRCASPGAEYTPPGLDLARRRSRRAARASPRPAGSRRGSRPGSSRPGILRRGQRRCPASETQPSSIRRRHLRGSRRVSAGGARGRRARRGAPARAGARRPRAHRRRPRGDRGRAGGRHAGLRRHHRLRPAGLACGSPPPTPRSCSSTWCARTPSAPARRWPRTWCAGCCCCSARRCGAGTRACARSSSTWSHALLERGVTPVVPSKGSVGLLRRPRAARPPRARARRRGRGDPRRRARSPAPRRWRGPGLEPRRAHRQGGARADQRHAPDGRRRRPGGARGPAPDRRRGGGHRAVAGGVQGLDGAVRRAPARAAPPARPAPGGRRACAACSRAARWSPATPTAAACRTRTRCAARRR